MNGAIKMSAFESIRQDLEEAKAFPKEQGASACVHAIPVSEIRNEMSGTSKADI